MVKMTITKISHPGSYHSVESFCSTCGKTIFQYVDFTGTDIIYRENWNTPTGWFHMTPSEFKCRGEYIEPDKDFPIKHFKTFTLPNFDTKTIDMTERY